MAQPEPEVWDAYAPSCGPFILYQRRRKILRGIKLLESIRRGGFVRIFKHKNIFMVIVARYDEALGYVKNLVIDGDNLSINDD